MSKSNRLCKFVSFCPLRTNSKRISNKNFRLLGERPLYQYTLRTMSNLNCDDNYLFVSNVNKYKSIYSNIKTLKRNSWLDRDKTRGFSIYKEFAKNIISDFYILIHATSPFIHHSTINDAINDIKSEKYDSAYCVKEIKNFIWFKDRPLNFSLNNIPRTQDIEPIYEETSAFYIFSREMLLKERRRIGDNPKKIILNPKESIDIDNEIDFKLAECYI